MVRDIRKKMKNISIKLLMFAVVFVIAGCSKSTESTDKDKGEENLNERYKDVEFIGQPMDILSSNIYKDDDGMVHNSVVTESVSENNFFTVEYTEKLDYFLNDDRMWEYNPGGDSIECEIIKDNLSGKYRVYEVKSTYGYSANDFVDVLMAKNEEWIPEREMQGDCINVELCALNEIKITGVIWSEYSDILEIDTTLESFPSGWLYELEWVKNYDGFTFTNETLSKQSAHLLIKESTGEIFIIAQSLGGLGDKRAYHIFKLYK